MFARRLFVLLALAAALFFVPALASAEAWNHNVSHEVGNATSVKIVGTEGLKVDVDGRSDSTPAIINLADQNAFVNITVTAPDGKTWSKKIEVKQYHQTVLTVTYVPQADKKDAPQAEAPKAAEPAAPARSHIGRLSHDSFDECRYVFMRDGQEVLSFQFDTDGDKDLELPAGNYEVRVFAHSFMDGDWKYIDTARLDVTADGWSYGRRDCRAP